MPTTTEIEYDQRDRVKSVNGFAIAADKHAYVCTICGAIWQSKNIECRSLFRTEDPQCEECDNSDKEICPMSALQRVCKCEPVIK